MKHSNLILCGVACFAFVCLFGTSCSKQPASIEKDGGIVLTAEVSVPNILDALTGHNLTPDYKNVFDFACRQMQEDESNDFLETFFDMYEQLDHRLAPLFCATMRDRIDPDMNNSDVRYVVRGEVEAAIDNSFNVLRTRLDRFGISNPTMQKLSNGRILIEIPDIKDEQRISKLIGSSANLEFWETYSLQELLSALQELHAQQSFFSFFADTENYSYSPVIGTANVSDTAKINEILRSPAALKILPRDVRFAWEVKPVDETGQYFRLIALKAGRRGCPALEGDVITYARADNNEYTGRAEVLIKMNSNGARRWEKITQENIGRAIAIVLDGYVYSFPVVMDVITGGSSQIAGNFTEEESKDLANVLKSGKMPAPVRILQIEVIEPAK